MRICEFEGCGRKHYIKGLCQAHWAQRYRRGQPLTPLKVYRPGAACSFEGCGRPHEAHGLCNAHLKQRAAGKRLHPVRPRGGWPKQPKLPAKVRRPDPVASEADVRRWLGECTVNGECLDHPATPGHRYPTIGYKGCEGVSLGRLVLQVSEGPSEGRYMLHSCGNKRCINPAHLRWGTNGENVVDVMRVGHSNQKLTQEDVREIRRRLAGGEARCSIAAGFGVTRQCVRCIETGATWGWLDCG